MMIDVELAFIKKISKPIFDDMQLQVRYSVKKHIWLEVCCLVSECSGSPIRKMVRSKMEINNT
jgi:hypothetical protein